MSARKYLKKPPPCHVCGTYHVTAEQQACERFQRDRARELRWERERQRSRR